jgi:integrase
LALTTGLRKGELLALQWDDVDFEEKTLTINYSLQYTKEKEYRLPTKAGTHQNGVRPSLCTGRAKNI